MRRVVYYLCYRYSYQVTQHHPPYTVLGNHTQYAAPRVGVDVPKHEVAVDVPKQGQYTVLFCNDIKR